MKILIVSDTHRHDENLIMLLKKLRNLDLVIHLGDAEGTEDYIQANADCPLEIVAGNNDFFSYLEREKELEFAGYRILLTHGHYYNVSLNTDWLWQEAKDRSCQIAMFGHTHRPLIERRDGIVLLNPGSLSYPRQEGRKPSYIMMEIDNKGEAHYTINYL